MNNIIKKPYEISVWEDVPAFLVILSKDGEVIEEQYYEDSLADFSNPDGAIADVKQFFKERKICTIGSDTMTSSLRAIQPKLTINTNGTTTLIFSLYYKYYDEIVGEYYDNPFVGYLKNERKIKLRHGVIGAADCKWYDLVIKNVEENSETGIFTYTAKDLFINELSKTGFDLVFDGELENNQGNIITLGSRILEGSDWKIPEDFEILLQQTVEEPLYDITLRTGCTAINMNDSSDIINIAENEHILGFYSCITNKEPYFQLIYLPDWGYEINERKVITNCSNYYLTNVTYDSNGYPDFVKYINGTPAVTISSDYRGERIVRNALTKYEPLLDRYVNVYKEGNREVYGYVDYSYISPITVTSYVTNGKDFDSFTGWTQCGVRSQNELSIPKLELKTLPDIENINNYNDSIQFGSYLTMNFTKPGQYIMNSGIKDYRSQLEGLVKGKTYVLRAKYGQPNESLDGITNLNKKLYGRVCEYTLSNGVYTLGKNYLTFDNLYDSDSSDYVSDISVCEESLSQSQLSVVKIGLFLYTDNEGLDTDFYLEELQFYEYTLDAEGNICYPGASIASGVIENQYYYYSGEDYSDADDIQYITPSNLETVYNDFNSYEKVRSINESETNRFNLIQTLCETFECWPNFIIEHDMETGEILLDEDYRQKKWVTFSEYFESENEAGFKYGINLKSIERTVESEDIVTKIIVKDNSNEFATDGYCSIARASENQTGENFIYDFSYYINQGLLNFNEINNDLYSKQNGYIGYYVRLKEYNQLRDSLIREQSQLFTSRNTHEASYQTYSMSVSTAEEQLLEKERELINMTGYSFETIINAQKPESGVGTIAVGDTPVSSSNPYDWKNNDKVVEICAAILRLKSIITAHTTLRDLAKAQLDEIDAMSNAADEQLKEISQNKLALELQFYKKYSRFIQEGPWISEEYTDDNLYYLDAQSTLYASSQPKISYKINVLELSQNEEYQNYVFQLGEKSYIEDTDFFGWQLINGVQTPIKEEIIVSEITYELDSPENNVVTVQNYKTQFEDLFQRINATTQTVEYNTGKYNRTSQIVSSDGTIAPTTLQNSIINSSLILENAKDQSVVWDSTGIWTTSLANPNEMVRMVSGGVFLSTDGGLSWNTGITGRGINASYITAGQIDTSLIRIMNGSFPSFRWDASGLNAYEFEIDPQTKMGRNFNYSKFIRFDQYGIYGINGISDFDPSVETNGYLGEEKIKQYADFSLTWKGFHLKSNHGENGGYISISSDKDFRVTSSNNKDLVVIGLLRQNSDGPIYGLQINDLEGRVVLENASDGRVWIRDELNIGYENQGNVKIGYLSEGKENADGKKIHEVIHAGDSEDSKFVVYEDGTMESKGGTFRGTIFATGGQIGNLQISEMGDLDLAIYNVVIESDSGVFFSNGTGTKTLTAYLYKGNDLQRDEGLQYQWYLNSKPISGATNKTITVSAEALKDTLSQGVTYSCEIKTSKTSG